ncbi:UDP-glycosyltransferase 75C1-like [Setaria italica]|uniref:UDP-glycosyltransferase 75C1-like n=1 Tax=Setaria italica TaxID=4555 RepID=UPI000645C506|nr:UDP-glycosyltransferase 75C1-like [Setaria italica]
MAAGLAATGRPFLLVVRDNNRELLPDDCLAAATGGDSRGKVGAWCDQGRVLSHRAVGCFVTHCGWNSTTEALASGVPVVAYPGVADQPTNATFLVDVYGVGVRLPRPMARDALRCCVEEVLSGPEAAAMRARAGEWKAEASAAQATGGSSDKGVRGFVDAVLSLDGAGDG